MTDAAHLVDPRAEAAIGWMVEINSGETSAKTQAGFEAWLQSDPRNEAAWIHLLEVLMPCGVAARQGLPQGVLTGRLLRRQNSRRAVLAGLVGLGGAGALGLAVTDRFVPVRHVLADAFTLTAQQKRLTLADGSELVLAPRTAITLSTDPVPRAAGLLDGTVMVRIASRSAPFRVTAGPITLSAGGGTFLVEKKERALTLSSLEGRASVQQDGVAPHSLVDNAQIVFVDNRIRTGTVDREEATAWINGLLVAKDRTVESVVEGLRPYVRGLIRVDPAVTALRVTGVFSLNDPYGSLNLIAEELGLEFKNIANFYVMLSLKA